MKKRVLLLLTFAVFLLCSCTGTTPSITKASRTITDMGGRSVTVPQTIQKVFCSNPIGTVNVYTLNPQLLAGVNFPPAGESRDYLSEAYLNLPSLGVWMGAGAVPNQEEIKKARPDVILCYWSADDAGRHMADAIQEQTKLSVVLMDCNISAAPEAYRFLGELLGETERAEALAQYCENALNRIRSALPSGAQKTVFVAQGRGGLQTDPVGSIHVQDTMDLLQLKNVADMPGSEGQGMGMPSVSYEQILLWNPELILVNEYNMGNNQQSQIYKEILSGATWANLSAVKSKQVYHIPQVPFSWFGKPPSAVRILGCLWLAVQLYPKEFPVDMASEIKTFYELFYQVTLSEEQVVKLLSP